jgi:O-antigen ligase
MLLIGGYVMSLPLGSVQVTPQTSLPFLFAIAFGCYKLYDMLAHHKGIRISPEVYVVVVMFLYLIGAEWFLHEGTIFKNYFISFGLNCVVLVLLADEFYRDPAGREKIMRLYVASMVMVAMMVTINLMTTSSQTGRLTIFGLNQNELAAALLIGYCWLSIEFMRTKWKLTGTQMALLLSASVVLNALISTGTRFALIAVIAVLLLLTISAFLDRSKVRNALIYVFISGVFIAYKTTSFTPMQERLLQANLGNNLTDLGGRIPLWRLAFDAFSEAPFVGLGYNGFEKFVLKHERFFGLPHNFPLEVAALAGVIGIIMVTVVVFILFWRIFVLGDPVNRADALIWSVAVLMIMLSLNITNLKMYWFLLAYFTTLDFGTKGSAILTKGLPCHIAELKFTNRRSH